METISVTSCVLEKYFSKSILHFNFSDDIKIKIFLSVEYSIVRQIFNEYFKEEDFEYRGEQPQCCFTFGEKRFTLSGATNLASDVSALTCQLLTYVNDYNKGKECEAVPLRHIKIGKYSIDSMAKSIVELLEE